VDPLKLLPSRIREGAFHTYQSLSLGWRQLVRSCAGALTRFHSSNANASRHAVSWTLLPTEVWETAYSVVVRAEIPGMARNDFDISVNANALRIRGEKHVGEQRVGSLIGNNERAFGRFERALVLPTNVDPQLLEVSYEAGVLTVILSKAEPIPPRASANPA
jgi:HSP20 family protein